GVKPDTESFKGEIFVLRETIMPAILIELEFIDVSETCQLVSNTNGDYYIQGVFALYDANKLLKPSEGNFVDFLIDGDIVSGSTTVYGTVLMKNTTSGQVSQTHDVDFATLNIGDPSDEVETNVSVEKNLTIRSINNGQIDCGSALEPVFIHL
ncbi:MAG: hypothetical protein GWN00_20170, partial [Aliifodinibius sp.]|nr:N-acetylmuramoyl-L-alanine amidase [Fodinibius sp.]NIV13331.1 hypothetical protein [Fodinibius sp.]NIY27039.1 hypothetical protein [Fodinibius sp.]